MNVLSSHRVNRTRPQLAGLIALVAALYVAAGVGMAYVAGFGAVKHRLEHAEWWWLAPSFGAVLLAFCGYYFAYRGTKRAPASARPGSGSVPSLALSTARWR